MKYSWEAEETCARARELGSLELDGELPEFEQAQLASHLQSCEDCRSLRDEVASFTLQLRAAPAELPSVPIALAALRRRRRYLGPTAAAAAVVVVGLGSVFGPLHAIDQRQRSQNSRTTLLFRDQRQQQQFARSQQLRTEPPASVASDPRAPLQ